jgi:hypothetical protein
VHDGGAGAAFLQLQGINQFNGPVNLSCKVTGGPSGNSVMPSCIVPPFAVVQTVRASASIVLINTESCDQRSSARNDRDDRRDSHYPLVPPGTYTAVVTGTTGAATHDVSVTIVVQDRNPWR